MRNSLIVLVSIIVISNLLEISSANRIKRDVSGNKNHTKISEDFVVLNTGSKKNLANKIIEPMTKKDNKSLYDAAVVAVTNKSINGEKSKIYHGNNERSTEYESIKKQTISSPLAYVLRNRDQKTAENCNETQRVSSQLPADNSKSYNTLGDIQDRQNLQDRNKSEVKVFPSFGQEAANIVGAHVIVPPRYLMSSHEIYPFAPIDQMIRFANSLFYKAGKDDVTAENVNSPIELNSLDSSSPHVLFGSPTYTLGQISSSHQGQKEYLPYSKTSNSKEPLPDRKSIDLIDLIENVFNNPQNNHAEIEIYCPLHNGKGNTAHGNCHTNSQTDDKYKGGVLEVCSCHLLQKDKDESHKNEK